MAPTCLTRITRALLLAMLLAGGLAVAPADPAGAACAAPSSKQLGGTLLGEDGRYISAMVGIELFDSSKRSIDINGCVKTPGGYSHTDLVNETSSCCFLLDHNGTTSPGYESTWSATRYKGAIPSNAAYAWIEVYPKSKSAGPNGHATSYARYGGAMRRYVSLRTDIALRLPLGCGLGPGGDNGTIVGTVVKNGQPVSVSRVAAWSRAADGPTVPMGFGVQGGTTGSFTFTQVSPGQSYGLSLTTSAGSFWVEHAYGTGIAVHGCQTTRVTIDVGHSPPRVRPTPARDGVGVRRDQDNLVTNALDGSGPSTVFTFGQPGDRLLYGDWDRDGIDTPGVRRGARFILSNDPLGKTPFITFDYGYATDTPVVGDWDGDGYDTVGIRRGTTFKLRNTNTYGGANLTFDYGYSSDTPIVGDWDGNGTDTIGIRRGTTFKLRNTNTYGGPHLTFDYGASTDLPFVGDFDGA